VDDRFYNSFLPPEVKICGVKLTRFSLYHHLILSAIGSPMATGGEVIKVSDLLVAVRVCKLDFGERDLSPKLRDIYWKWKLSKNKELFRKHVEMFYEWMNLQCSPPKFYIKRNGFSDGINKVPRCLGLVCSLMNRGGLELREAWNQTMGQAMWMDAQFALLDGLELRFLDDEDLDDSEIDLSGLTDDEAMELFTKDLPAELVRASFENWRQNIKRKESESC